MTLLPRKANNDSEKLKCPVCGFKFIPKFFHLEKVDYELAYPDHNSKLLSIRQANGDIKPLNIIRRSWNTICPKCSYIMKFAAEIGKKEVVSESSSFSLVHRKEFKENGKSYKYKFYTIEKPFKEHTEYNRELIEKIQAQVLEALEGVDLNLWGTMYKAWRREGRYDSFKFLIRFISNLEKYSESKGELEEDQEFVAKLQFLNLSEDLIRMITDINLIKNKTIDSNYDLDKSDETLIEFAFIRLLYELVYQHLKPLNLNAIKFNENFDEIDRIQFFTALRNFIYNYLYAYLVFDEFSDEFIVPLLEQLKIPLK